MQFLAFLLCLSSVAGHGYLADPPARSSAWLFDPDFAQCCTFFDHTQMSCGGMYQQWFVNGGKCSICGEPFDRTPKLFDMGGQLYLGKIVRTYGQGAVIPVTVVLTANHLGNFEFRVCNLDQNPAQDATQDCLDLNQLSINAGLLDYPINATAKTVLLNVTLPAALTCQHCVFQWKYRTGNSWGSWNGKTGLGYGRENEEFYGCSDIAIVSTDNEKLTADSVVTAISGGAVARRQCTLAVTFSRSFDISSVMEEYCQKVCSNNCAAENVSGNTVLYRSCQDSCAKLCTCQ